jgi:hypothetical protein
MPKGSTDKNVWGKHTMTISVAERRGRVVSTPASHPGGPGFKSRPGDRLS